MKKNDNYEQANSSRWSAFLTAFLALVFGAALVFWRGITEEIIITASAVILSLVGLVCILRYILRRGPYSFSDLDLCIGILSLLSGILLYIFRDALLPMLFTLFGIAVFTGGIVKLQLAFNARRFMAAGWFIPLCFAALSCSLGVLIIVHPGFIADIVTRFIGASIMAEAIVDMISYLLYRGMLKRVV